MSEARAGIAPVKAEYIISVCAPVPAPASNEQLSTAPAGEQPAASSSGELFLVFVGQLAYTATSQALMEHFEAGGVDGVRSVRLLTDKTTGRSRGMAFVQLASADGVQAALRLHHTTLNGRRINVERSCGGVVTVAHDRASA